MRKKSRILSRRKKLIALIRILRILKRIAKVARHARKKIFRSKKSLFRF